MFTYPYQLMKYFKSRLFYTCLSRQPIAKSLQVLFCAKEKVCFSVSLQCTDCSKHWTDADGKQSMLLQHVAAADVYSVLGLATNT